MSKLTIIPSKDMVKILESLGFCEIRQKGSYKGFKFVKLLRSVPININPWEIEFLNYFIQETMSS